MSNHKNLVFFNKEGDYLNFNYSDQNDRFEGDILFHENSTDTFKTYGLYMMENIPSFEFELPGQLTTRKFQLFNEYGLHLYGAKYENQQITSISPVNNDSEFYSKWVYGDDFDVKFPIGTLIEFDDTLLEFTDLDRTYVVVRTKKNAIMIISQMDNDTFETTYYTDYTNTSTFNDKTISGINAVGVYNYIDDLYNNNLSQWNEPDFYDKYYIGKKLNIVNSEKNDGTYTVDDVDLTDQPHFEYFTDTSLLPDESDLIIEVITRTDVPKVYEGGMNILSDGTIQIGSIFDYPQILKPGIEFKIVGSINNQNFLTVASIPEWNGIVNQTYFATQSQVIYNNKIYQCVQGYTQDFSNPATSFVTPLDSNYWSIPTYVKVDQTTVAENILFGQIYLTSDKYYFSYGWTSSAEVTMASAADKYKEDLSIFNIDLFYRDDIDVINADLVYPSKYAIVNFYHTQVGPTYSIGSYDQKVERLVGVEEHLDYELNYDLSENFRYNIVFTDLDEFGLKIIVNGMVYEEEIAWVYSGAAPDMERTIDRTLRNWLVRNYLRLFSLGIIAELQYIGNYSSVFYNSIVLKTEYPNVPIDISDILVGTTADYYVEHSRVLFDTGSYSIPYVNITINDDLYGIQSSYYTSTNITDIPTTLQNWVDEHAERLLEFGIIVTNINYLLRFDVKDPNRRLDYTINTGRLNIPGLYDYEITPRLLGNHGMLIASNEVILPEGSSQSFEESGFATGMVFSINNTFYPWVNQDFNIQFLDPQILNLSYQGPFWGLTDSLCNNSPFITLAFDLGFGQTACVVPIGPTAGSQGGPFGPVDPVSGLLTAFDLSAFSISYNPNTYAINNYDLNSLPGTTGLVDIDYIQLSSSLYAFGDNLVVFDAFYGNYMTTVLLPGNTQSIEMEFNPVNNYLYLLSQNQIHIVDPLINTLVATMSMTYSAYDMEINPTNGDVYISYSDLPQVHIWYSTNLTNNPDVSIVTPSPFDTMTGMMVFNDFENDMYVTTDSDLVVRIDGDTRTFQTSYGVPGLTHSIFYEPVNEAIYVYGGSNLWKIDNGVTQSIALASQTFNDIIFNNITGQMNISDSSNNFTRLELSSNTYLQTGLGDYGYLALNQFDTDIYLSSQVLNNILVIKPSNGVVLHTAPLAAQATRLVYNPERKSIWAIQPSINSVVEIEVEVNTSIGISPNIIETIEDNQYGTLDPGYEPRPSIWLKTREYIRKPRENFEGDVRVQYYWRWLSDNVPEFFMYDFSGVQLDRTTTDPYTYTGERPLPEVVLNYKPNKDINKISYPQYQQTIFDKIEYDLSYIDDEDDISSDVEPLQLFLGFKSMEEGAIRSILQLFKKEEIKFDILSDSITNITLKTVEERFQGVTDRYGLIEIDQNSNEVFTGRGLKPGQIIVIYLKDTTNTKNQYTSDNNASLFKIRGVFTSKLTLDFINPNDIVFDENTVVNDYPSVGNTTYLKFTLKVKDREIGRFNTYGQTEDEDERFKIELGNVGKLINPSDVFIFKEYDILEGGIDWKYLNMKRKEMLMMKHLIYPYIGAYKSIINAINYFGYNDLQLNEYYRNVDQSSKDFFKLFKVEIPDIFDNTVEGWTENDFIKNTYPNDNFEPTNMFNLTYNITDKSGNNALEYSVDEVIIKLQGLKFWLKKNIIPLTHKIMDITGKSYFNGGTYITHKLHDTRIFNIKQNMTPITFNLNESYLMPVNSGSTVYNCVLDLYSIIPDVGTNIDIFSPAGSINEKPKPYNGVELISPDYFDIKIRTYKTYKEWVPSTTYNIGDRIIYFDKLYESVIDNNRINNPRKFESSQPWLAEIEYETATVVEYNRDYYVSKTYSVSNISPNLNIGDWLKITEWKHIDYDPVQTIYETRSGDNLLPFNFTIDSNLDPFLVIEVTSDNGYGSIYKDRKNYEVRGTKDLTESYSSIDPIGPFQPIDPYY